VTKISQLTSIGDGLAVDDQFLIRDISDATTPNKSVTVSGITRALVDGSAASPAIAFAADKNTGIYSPGADQVAISTNGTGRLSISSVGLITADTGRFVVGTTGSSAGISDISFGALTGGAWINTPSGKTGYLAQAGTGAYTWASDRHTWNISGSECMRLDSSGRVGIGTTGPLVPLDIRANQGTLNLTAGSDPLVNLNILNPDTTAGTGPTIAFSSYYSSTSSGPLATIAVERVNGAGTGAGTLANDIIIRQAQTSAVALTERMRIDSSGRLLVGTSTNFGDAATVQSIGTNAYTFQGFRFGGDSGLISLGSANGTQAGPSILTTGNLNIAGIVFRSYDSAVYRIGAQITAVAESEWASADCPTRLVFSTTADGAGSPTERMRISNAGTTTLTSAASTAPFIANISATEVARIDSSGRLLVGTSTSIGTSGGFTPGIQVAANASAAMSVGRYVSSASGPGVVMQKSRNATIGAHTIVNSGDTVGNLTFEGSDGSAFINAAEIKAEVDGTPGTNDMPGRLIFSTTADGASSPTERMRIDSSGRLHSPSYPDAGSVNCWVLRNQPGSTDATAAIETITSATGERFALTMRNGATTGNASGNIEGSISYSNQIVNISARSTLVLKTNATERARIDSSGRLLVGTSTSNEIAALDTQIQLAGTSGGSSLLSLQRYSNNSSSAGIYIGKSRGTSAGSFTAVQQDDVLGDIRFYGANGTDLSNLGARISAEVDGEPFTAGDTTDLPGRLVFLTTADGASSPTERLRITSAGVLQVAEAGNIAVGTTTGTKIGTATTQKIGFYNATPVVQPTAVADATDAASVITQLNALLTRMRNLGLIAT
jgi:hypothetical protein